MAARVKLPPERILALERGSEPLVADGRGRALAGALARAIGADPDEALRHVGRPPGTRSVRRAPFAPGRPGLRAWATAVMVLTLVAGAALGAAWILAPDDDADEATRRVYRRDYVEDLLERPGS